MSDHVTNRLQKIRLLRGVTQEALADAVEVSRQTISALEKGNYTPSVLLALRLAAFFRVSVEDIFSL